MADVTYLQETKQYPAHDDSHSRTVYRSQDLVFTSDLVVPFSGETVRALDLCRTVGTIVGATAEGGIDAGLGGTIVVGAGDAAAFQLEIDIFSL